MGQKVFKNNSRMTFEGFYSTNNVYESCLSAPFLKESTNAYQHMFNTFCDGYSQCCLSQDSIGQSLCEFQDYCNHLYYMDDRCDCALAWQKTTGLVIPTFI
jgi:hypothetical protein